MLTWLGHGQLMNVRASLPEHRLQGVKIFRESPPHMRVAIFYRAEFLLQVYRPLSESLSILNNL